MTEQKPVINETSERITIWASKHITTKAPNGYRLATKEEHAQMQLDKGKSHGHYLEVWAQDRGHCIRELLDEESSPLLISDFWYKSWEFLKERQTVLLLPLSPQA